MKDRKKYPGPSVRMSLFALTQGLRPWLTISLAFSAYRVRLLVGQFNVPLNLVKKVNRLHKPLFDSKIVRNK